MYEWLTDALQGPSTVVTANRRLARVLQEEFTHRQLRAGVTAWQSPEIRAWHDWLPDLLLKASNQAALPTRINQHQSQLLWERCLGKEIGDSATGITNLVRLARDAWQRLADWRVGIRELARSAQSDDQRLFAAAAGRYLGILEREGWVDDAGLPALADALIRSGRIPVDRRVTFAGFDRERPAVVSIQAAFAESGCIVESAPVPKMATDINLQCHESAEAELRAAGAWARERLEAGATPKIAIIAGDLEQQAERKTRLVRESLVPGWQYGDTALAQSVNVSYGRRLIDYPAISIALLAMKWLARDLASGDIGHLLRTPMLGSPGMGGRARLELRLRRLPDRDWSPSMLTSALRGNDDCAAATEWLALVASISKLRRGLRKNAAPAEWAVYIDETLSTLRWPGVETLDSFDFQLVNRWRDLLNDLARLDLVSPVMSLEGALRRLEIMASDTVFQPESTQTAVQLIGPLEAAGAEFDAIWISGLTAARWPPAGNPSALISRRLQKQSGMPDAEPADTVAYARQVLTRLAGSATDVVCSYPLTEDDAEQTPSELLQSLDPKTQVARQDPDWHAIELSRMATSRVVADSVPPISQGEQVSGGAGTIQRQLVEPLAAFIVGRLGVNVLQTQAVGIPAPLRGNMIHDALYKLYLDKPSRSDIAGWSDADLSGRIASAVDFAFGRHERNTDPVLLQLLAIERQRISGLLRQFVNEDGARGDFAIASVEHEEAFEESGVRLKLRVDRIDRLADDTVVILDYKTGSTKKFLQSDGMPREIQLVVYASAMQEPVSALALVNIDSREIRFDGAGRGYTEEQAWQETLGAWKERVRLACEELSRGDVRINAPQGVRAARNLNLLTRYTELSRNA